MLEFILEVIEFCLRYGDKYLIIIFVIFFIFIEFFGEILLWILSGELLLDFF